MKQLIMVAVNVFLLILGGCATTYSCNTRTAGKCQTISDVYKHVDKNPDESPERTQKELSTEYGPKNGGERFKEPLAGKPILREPKVLRVLLNYWEDEEKDLNLGGYVFVKVRDVEWELH